MPPISVPDFHGNNRTYDTLSFKPPAAAATVSGPALTEMLKNIRVVLVRPKGSGNIGSVARAMKNTGLCDLALVGGGRTESLSARSMAVHAHDVLDGARRFETIREAVADCGLVVGTTCRKGLYRDHVELPREAARDLVAAVRGEDAPPAALIFGPEDHGLSNADLKYCQRLVTIPSHPEQPSLNLAQAVMVCLYEVYLGCGPRPRRRKSASSAPPRKRSKALFDRMKETLLKVGFLDPQNPRAHPARPAPGPGPRRPRGTRREDPERTLPAGGMVHAGRLGDRRGEAAAGTGVSMRPSTSLR